MERVEFGGPTGHTCDLMALDSNAMKDKFGKSFHILRPVRLLRRRG